MKNLKTKDQVIVIAGKDKGKIGEVVEIIKGSKSTTAVVSGVNSRRKCVKNTPNQAEKSEDGFKLINAPIHISNLAIYNPEIAKKDKIKIVLENDAKKRVYKKTSKPI